MKLHRMAVAAMGVLALSTGLKGAELEKKGAHGGTLIGDSSVEFEVVVDQKGEQVSAYMVRSEVGKPDKVSVILYSEAGAGPIVELESVEPGTEAPPLYQGKLTAWSTPYIGFSLRVSLDGKQTRVLKSEENP